MTDLDDLPFTTPDPDPTRPAREPARCRKHEWVTAVLAGDEMFCRWCRCRVEIHEHCARCPTVHDLARARRGKSARRLGGDTERYVERRYGPEKIGERGDPVDHLGRVWKWQSKATRDTPPKWLATVTEPRQLREAADSIMVALWKMRGLYGPRVPVVIRSYVHQGARTRDWLWVEEKSAAEYLGIETAAGTEWVVIPGDWWLDHFGRDEP